MKRGRDLEEDDEADEEGPGDEEEEDEEDGTINSSDTCFDCMMRPSQELLASEVMGPYDETYDCPSCGQIRLKNY